MASRFTDRYWSLLLLLLLLSSFKGGAEDFSFSLKVAPVNSQLFLGNLLLQPQREERGYRFYRIEGSVEEGELSSLLLTLSAPGYRDRVLSHPSLSEPFPKTAGPGASLDVQLQRLESSFQLEGLVETGSQPKSVLFIDGGRKFVTALLNGEGIEVFDTLTLERLADSSPPHELAKKLGFVELLELKSRRELWVSQMTTDSIHIFSLDSFSFLRTIPAGGAWPKVLLSRPDEAVVYVSHWTGRSVAEIDTASGEVKRRFPVPGIPRGLVLSRNGEKLFVANYSNGNIEVINLEGGESHTWKSGPGAMRHLVLSPDGRRLYGTDMLQGTVLALDPDSETLLWERRVGSNVNTLDIDSRGIHLYVSSRGRNGVNGYLQEGEEFGTISLVDAKTGELIERVWGGDQPTGLDFSPDQGLLAFTDFLDHRIELFRIVPSPRVEDSPW